LCERGLKKIKKFGKFKRKGQERRSKSMEIDTDG